MTINHLGGQSHATVTCPFCFETISIAVDLSQNSSQQFEYDCEVCCRPISIRVSFDEHQISIEAERGYD